MTLYGIDVSEHQNGINLAASGADFCIVRLNYGINHPDMIAKSHIDDWRKTGKPHAYYTWLRPSRIQNIGRQADVAKSMWLACGGDSGVWVDVEEPGTTRADVANMVNALKERGVPVIGCYSRHNFWNALPGGAPAIEEAGGAIWVAHYTNNPTGPVRNAYPGDGHPVWSQTLSGRIPDIWQFTEKAYINGTNRMVDGNAFRGNHIQLQELFKMSGSRPAIPEAKPSAFEIVIPYKRDQVWQDTYYNCAPAAVQTIVRSVTDKFIPESELGRRMGTTTNGTDHISYLARVLNEEISGANYKTVDIDWDGASDEELDTLWNHLVRSISYGRPIVANLISPPNNRPKAAYTSTDNLRYGSGTVYHYVALMGVAQDSKGRYVWWADSGFEPYGSWITLEQTASLIAGKGYAWPSSAPLATIQQEDVMTPEQMAELKKYLTDFIVGFVGPAISDIKDNRQQLTGGRDKGEYPGWPQLDDRSMVDALAVIGDHLDIPGFNDVHGGSLKDKNAAKKPGVEVRVNSNPN